MGIGDWGLGIGDWAQSPIPNPQSPMIKYINSIYLIEEKNLHNLKMSIFSFTQIN